MASKDPAKNAIYNAAYHATHREEIAARKAASRTANIEKARAQEGSRRATNREKLQAQDKARYAANPEKYRAQRRARHAANPEQRNAKARARRLANPAQHKAYGVTWYWTHREEASMANAVWRATHQDEIRAYRVAHPERGQVAWQRRRAHKANAPVNDFTPAQWREMQAAYDHRCVYCGKRRKGTLTQDHITALSQGGSHTYRNIVPACGSCNSRKHAGPVLVPVQPLLVL